jgi:hypothetical protein
MTDEVTWQWCLEQVIWQDLPEGTRLTAKQVIDIAIDASDDQVSRAFNMYRTMIANLENPTEFYSVGPEESRRTE